MTGTRDKTNQKPEIQTNNRNKPSSSTSEANSSTGMLSITHEQLQSLLTNVLSNFNNQQSIPIQNNGNFAKCSARFSGAEDIEAFIDAIETYKQCANITDENSLRGLSMLFTGNAATWWHGIKGTTDTWTSAIRRCREAFSERKPPFRIYRELFAKEQDETTSTVMFVCQSRALLADIPDELSEKIQLDMVYGLLNRKIRKRLTRDSVNSFAELLTKARGVEDSLKESSNSIQTTIKSNSNENLSQHRTKSDFCRYCKKRGHDIMTCQKRNDAQERKTNSEESTASTSRLINTISCYGCGQPGVIRSKCNKCSPSIQSSPKVNSAEFNTFETDKLSNQVKPILPIKILGRNGIGLADTGATRSIAGRSLYELIKDECRFQSEKLIVTLADGVQRHVQAKTFSVNIEIANVTVTTTLLFLPSLSDNRTILGIDFLKKVGIILDLTQDQWYIKDKPHIKFQFHPDIVTNNISAINISSVSLRTDEGVLNEYEREELNGILESNASVFSLGGGSTPYAESTIEILDNKEPIVLPPIQKREILEQEFNKMSDDIIEESENQCTSPEYIIGDQVFIESSVLCNASQGISSKFIPKGDGPNVMSKIVSSTSYEMNTSVERPFRPKRNRGRSKRFEDLS